MTFAIMESYSEGMLVTGVKGGVHTDAISCRQVQMFNHTGTWHKVFLRNFRIDAAFDSMSALV